eukprot:TRINITY_DN10236_c0_g1_i1.p1 TRINITY_DN10236_c0_g1~~TRINITY_DN10236_c0_g1_i1.p1  ORF type:complete len:410 (+),score=88.38 TRINITY_DN10236_c0_g1_i1:280-1509(+)
MLLSALAEEAAPELFLAPLVLISTKELVCVGLTSSHLWRRIFSCSSCSADASAPSGGTIAGSIGTRSNSSSSSCNGACLALLAREAHIAAAHVPAEQDEVAVSPARSGRLLASFLHIHGLGLPPATAAAYAAELSGLAPLHALNFACSSELEALLDSRRRASETKRPAGFVRTVGEAWAVAEFHLLPSGGVSGATAGPACSQWRWIDMDVALPRPPLGRRNVGATPASNAAVAAEEAAGAMSRLRVGVQLVAGAAGPEATSGRCSFERAELRCCAVRAPPALRSQVILQAVSASPGLPFHLGLSASDFHCYGQEEGGWYLPREECSWRACDSSSSSSSVSSAVAPKTSPAQEEEASVRLLLHAVCAARPDGGPASSFDARRLRRKLLRGGGSGSGSGSAAEAPAAGDAA